MARILIVDDEANIRRAIKEFSRLSGHTVTEAADGGEAVELCRRMDFDAIIMDIMMPVMDGFEAYAAIRKIKYIPAIILTAKGEEYDKLHGFRLGIDDYVVKPFSGLELMARLDVVLNRNATSAPYSAPATIQAGALSIDTARRLVSVGDAPLDMTNKEYALLLFLVQNQGIVFSREQLLDNIWGGDFIGYDRTVDAHIKMLRHSLGEYRHYIVTNRGVGYKFEAQD